MNKIDKASVTDEDEKNVVVLLESLGIRVLSVLSDYLLCDDAQGIKLIAKGETQPATRVGTDGFEPFDEAFFLPSHNRLVFAHFAEESICLKLGRFDASGNLVEDGTLYVPTPFRASELISDRDTLFCYKPSEAEPEIAAVLQIQLVPTTNGSWDVDVASHKRRSVPGQPAAFCGQALVSLTDRTPFDPLLQVFDINGRCFGEASARAWVCTDHAVVCAGIEKERYGCYVINGERTRFLPLPGYVGQLVLRGNVALATIYVDGQETIYQFSITDDPLVPVEILGGSGKKILFATDTGPVVLKRDTIAGLSLISMQDVNGLGMPEYPIGKWSNLPFRPYRLHSPAGACAIIHTPSSQTPNGVILHFHGGPDSYEVEELRFFGAFRTLMREGFMLATLNYRGSEGLSPSAHRAAWGRWHETFPEDLEWLLATMELPPSAPIVAAGWSFGGSLALVASRFESRISDVIVGGAMTNLRRHRARAAVIDPAYVEWFAQRFGEDTDDSPCNRFFNLQQGLRHDTSVLSFHGKQDGHCSYDDLLEAQQAAVAECTWIHRDLPGGGHYAECLEDAQLIYQETLAFIHSVHANSWVENLKSDAIRQGL